MGIFNRQKLDDKAKRIAKSNAKVAGATLRVTLPPRPPITEGNEGLFEQCPGCKSVIYGEDLINNYNVCPTCGYHYRLSARQRILWTADEGTFEEFNAHLVGENPLDFPGYEEKIINTRAYAKEEEAVVTGTCEIGGQKAVLAVMDSNFMMGSMGAAVGEKFTLAAEKAMELGLGLIAFTVSGGARMQEGLVSLMQMAKTSAAIAKMGEKRLPYFVVLTDPTTGGVTASFAMLGDVILSEPGATVGFAGRRVIEQTVKQVLPKGFQKAEFLMEKGFVDCIVERQNLKNALSKLLKIYAGGKSE